MLWKAENQNKLLSDKGVLCSLLKSLLVFEFQGPSWVAGVFFNTTVSFNEKFWVSLNC